MPSVFGEMFTYIGLASATSMTVGERSETTVIQDYLAEYVRLMFASQRAKQTHSNLTLYHSFPLADNAIYTRAGVP